MSLVGSRLIFKKTKKAHVDILDLVVPFFAAMVLKAVSDKKAHLVANSIKQHQY